MDDVQRLRMEATSSKWRPLLRFTSVHKEFHSPSRKFLLMYRVLSNSSMNLVNAFRKRKKEKKNSKKIDKNYKASCKDRIWAVCGEFLLLQELLSLQGDHKWTLMFPYNKMHGGLFICDEWNPLFSSYHITKHMMNRSNRHINIFLLWFIALKYLQSEIQSI